MEPLTTAALISMIPGLAKTGFGAFQTLLGRKTGQNNPFPNFDYQVPQGALDALNVQKNLASNTSLPGQSLMERKLGEQTANSVNDLSKVSTSSSDIVNGLGRIYGNQMSNTTNLDLAAVENYQRNQQGLADQENRIGEYQNEEQKMEFDWNKKQPYLQTAAASSALKGAGIQNLFSGTSDMAGSWANTYVLNDLLKKYETPTAKSSAGSAYKVNPTGYAPLLDPTTGANNINNGVRKNLMDRLGNGFSSPYTY